MKILAIADIHAEEFVIDRLRILLSKNNYDAVFIVGDLSQKGPISFVEELLAQMPPVYAVHGNMDSKEVEDFLNKKGVNIHGKKVKLAGADSSVSVAGLGGSNPTPFTTPIEYSEQEIERTLANLKLDSKTILLAHPPPYGVFDVVADDIHVGSQSLFNAIQKSQPMLVLCAHIHEHEGTGKIGKTPIVKLAPASNGRAAEIKIEKDKALVNFIDL
ncbi:MAG: metallophosphoesterase [Candidatus Micrarchaeota archaeon]